MTSVQSDVREYQHFIGGEWIAGEGGTFEDRDPFTGDVVALVPAGTRAEAARAIDAASDGVPRLVADGPRRAAADLPQGRRRAREPPRGGRRPARPRDRRELRLRDVPDRLRAQPAAPGGRARLCAGGPDHPVGSSRARSRWACASRSASSAAIAPWNAALILSARSIAAPLALGNTVVLKPSELSPVVGGLIWGEIFAEAGLPAGVLNIVTHAPGEAGPIGDELVENQAVRRINFTGSTETGRRLAEACGRQLKRVVLELGGHNPLIVLADADLDYAVNASIFGAFLHQGQICMSSRRIFVERPVADEFTARLAEKAKTLKAGDPKEHDTIIGPLINESALSMVKGRVDEAVAKGAKVLAGGEAVGPCYQATVLTDVPQDSDFAQHETFGPVVSVETVDSAEEAVARANATSYGLSAGIFTGDTESRASRSRSSSTRGSRTSTTSRSATSRRCRSAASRTPASAGSAGRR